MQNSSPTGFRALLQAYPTVQSLPTILIIPSCDNELGLCGQQTRHGMAQGKQRKARH